MSVGPVKPHGKWSIIMRYVRVIVATFVALAVSLSSEQSFALDNPWVSVSEAGACSSDTDCKKDSSSLEYRCRPTSYGGVCQVRAAAYLLEEADCEPCPDPAPTFCSEELDCGEDIDCDDGDPMTTNMCVNGICIAKLAPFGPESCQWDTDCDDEDGLTTDTCVSYNYMGGDEVWSYCLFQTVCEKDGYVGPCEFVNPNPEIGTSECVEIPSTDAQAREMSDGTWRCVYAYVHDSPDGYLRGGVHYNGPDIDPEDFASTIHVMEEDGVFTQEQFELMSEPGDTVFSQHHSSIPGGWDVWWGDYYFAVYFEYEEYFSHPTVLGFSCIEPVTGLLRTGKDSSFKKNYYPYEEVPGMRCAVPEWMWGLGADGYSWL